MIAAINPSDLVSGPLSHCAVISDQIGNIQYINKISNIAADICRYPIPNSKLNYFCCHVIAVYLSLNTLFPAYEALFDEPVHDCAQVSTSVRGAEDMPDE